MATTKILLAQAGTSSNTTNAGGAIMDGLRTFGTEIGQALPNILGAAVVLILGVVVANVLGNLVRRLMVWSKVDRFVQSSEVPTGNLDSLGIKFQAANVGAGLIKWLIILLAIAIAADLLQWTQVTLLMDSLVSYLPNMAAAILLLIGGYALSNLVGTFISGMGGNLRGRTAQTIGNLARYAILVFAAMAALIQLGIAENIILIAFIGLMTAVSLAAGLAFGLGGRDKARELLSDIKPPNQMTSS